MVIGKLCLNTLSSPIVDNFEAYTGPAIHKIWPVTEASLAWPGASSLGDREVISLAEAIAANGIRV